MWIDTRDSVPLEDGEYIVQTVYGNVTSMNYTHKGGWNTHYADGELYDENAMDNLYVVRWYSVLSPKAVPKEWKEEYWKGSEHEAPTGNMAQLGTHDAD